jgi:hypothetical protein
MEVGGFGVRRLGFAVRRSAGGRLWRLALALKPRSDTKAHQPALAGDRVHHNIGGLDVLVDNGTLMQVINRGRKADSQTQRKRYVQRLAEQFIERLRFLLKDILGKCE